MDASQRWEYLWTEGIAVWAAFCIEAHWSDDDEPAQRLKLAWIGLGFLRTSP